MDIIPEELQKIWAPVVGAFILEFGHIESAITEVIRLSFLSTQFKTLRSLPFGKKSELVKALLADWNASESEIVNSSFRELSEITQRRNIVAHNGFSMAIYESPDVDGYHYEFGMTSSHKATEVWLQKEDIERDTIAIKAITQKIINWIQRDKIRNITLSESCSPAKQ